MVKLLAILLIASSFSSNAKNIDISKSLCAEIDFTDPTFDVLYHGWVKVFNKDDGRELINTQFYNDDLMLDYSIKSIDDVKFIISKKENHPIIIYDDFNLDGIMDFAIRNDSDWTIDPPNHMEKYSIFIGRKDGVYDHSNIWSNYTGVGLFSIDKNKKTIYSYSDFIKTSKPNNSYIKQKGTISKGYLHFKEFESYFDHITPFMINSKGRTVNGELNLQTTIKIDSKKSRESSFFYSELTNGQKITFSLQQNVTHPKYNNLIYALSDSSDNIKFIKPSFDGLNGHLIFSGDKFDDIKFETIGNESSIYIYQDKNTFHEIHFNKSNRELTLLIHNDGIIKKLSNNKSKTYGDLNLNSVKISNISYVN